MEIVPLIIGCLRNVRSLHDLIGRCIESEIVHWIATEMQRVVVHRAETIIQKITSGLTTM